MNIFGKKGSNDQPKPRALLSQSKTLSKKTVSSKPVHKVSSIPLVALKTALVPYKEAIIDDIKTLFGVDNKSRQNRMDYESFMNTYFKKEK